MRAVVCSVVVLLIMIVLPPGGAREVPDPESYPHLDGWAAPHDHKGDLSIAFTVDFGHPNSCSLRLEWASEGSDNPLLYKMQHVGGAASGGDTTSYLLAPGVDTRSEPAVTSFAHRMTIPLSNIAGQHDFWFVVADASMVDKGPDGTWGPLEYMLGCEQPFETLNLQGGKNILGFVGQTFSGIGASAWTDDYSASIHANFAGSIEHEVPEDKARLWWLSSGNGAGFFNVANEGESRRWIIPSATTGSLEYGGGSFKLDLDRGSASDILGVLVGLEDVESFDDVLSGA